MEEWKEYKLGEVGKVVGGATPSTKGPQNYDGDIAWITPKDLSNNSNRYIDKGERMITQKGYESCSCKMLPEGSVLFSSRAPIGYVAIAKNELCTNQGFKSIVPNPEITDNIFLYYLLVYNKDKIEGMGSGTTFKEVSGKVMSNITVLLPSLPTQQKIANILSSLDDKIEVNRRINEQLEEMAQALFKSWFVDFEPFKDSEFVESELGMIPKGWKVGKAEDFYKITIGKTPPRKEQVWFTESIDDVKWVSISDMGNCGCFIADSSEYLTNEAIQKFNIGIVPEDTILLSFKLTIGRVAIAMCDLTTNEAIARFCLSDNALREYTYLMLKQYNYANLGSTSSIATAVNSKIIKQMRVLMPQSNVLEEFNKVLKPLFENIKKNQQEITHLTALRDTLLPKLMSGEIKV